MGVLEARVRGGGPGGGPRIGVPPGAPGGLAVSILGDRPGPVAPAGGGGRSLGGPFPFMIFGSQLPCCGVVAPCGASIASNAIPVPGGRLALEGMSAL